MRLQVFESAAKSIVGGRMDAFALDRLAVVRMADAAAVLANGRHGHQIVKRLAANDNVPRRLIAAQFQFAAALAEPIRGVHRILLETRVLQVPFISLSFARSEGGNLQDANNFVDFKYHKVDDDLSDHPMAYITLRASRLLRNSSKLGDLPI